MGGDARVAEPPEVDRVEAPEHDQLGDRAPRGRRMHHAVAGKAGDDMEVGETPAAVADPILKRFRAALDEMYDDRLERVVLFGSRARGDAREDSDYDVAVFLKGFTDRWQEVDRLIPVVTDIIDDTGAVIHAMPYRAGAYNDRTSLMDEIRREGVEL